MDSRRDRIKGPAFLSTDTSLQHLLRRVHSIGALWHHFEARGLLPATSLFSVAETWGDAHRHLMSRSERNLRLGEAYRDISELVGNNPASEDVLPKAHYAVDIRETQWWGMLSLADAVSYLDYYVTNRLFGLTWSEAVLGSHTSARRGGGDITTYDAAETLMKDYVESVLMLPPDDRWVDCRQRKLPTYDGLVVFGYSSHTASYPFGLVIAPIFMAVRPGFFPVLAHEACHLIQANYFRHELEELAASLVSGTKLLAACNPLVSVATDRHVPLSWQARRMAGELISDCYATIVAGPAYALALAEHWLATIVDTMVRGERIQKDNLAQYDPYFTYTISALKARLALQLAEELNYDAFLDNDTRLKEALRNVDDHVSVAKRVAIEIVGGAFAAPSNGDPYRAHRLNWLEHLASAVGVDLPSGVPSDLSGVRRLIETVLGEFDQQTGDIVGLALAIGHQMASLKGLIRFDCWKPVGRQPECKRDPTKIKEELAKARLLLRNAERKPGEHVGPTPAEAMSIAGAQTPLRPRHLVHLLAENDLNALTGDRGQPGINVNAILTALSCHSNTTSRYRTSRG